MKIKEPIVKIGIVKDATVSKLSLNLEKRDDLTINKLKIDDKIIVLENENEVLITSNTKNVQLIVEPDYLKIQELTGLVSTPKIEDVKHVNLVIDKKIIDKVSDKILEAIPNVAKNITNYEKKKNSIIKENKSNISDCHFSLNSHNDLEIFFFIDVENIIKENTYFKKILNNIKDYSIFYEHFKISDIKLYRERINGISKNKFDINESDELIATNKKEEYDLFDTKRTRLYKFFDRSIKEKTYGMYRYYIELSFEDYIAKFLQVILEDSLNNIKKLEEKRNSRAEVYNIENYISSFNNLEQILYGNTSKVYVNDFKTLDIFIKKYVDTYEELKIYYNSVNYRNLITVRRDFHNFFDCESIIKEENEYKIDIIKSFFNKKDKNNILDINFGVQLYEPKSKADFFTKYGLGQSSTNIIKEMNKEERFNYNFKILLGFEDGVIGERWLEINRQNINEFEKLPNEIFLCKFESDLQLPFYNQLNLLENNIIEEELVSDSVVRPLIIPEERTNKDVKFDFDIVRDESGNIKTIKVRRK